MKDIEIKCASKEKALEIISGEFRLPEDTFDVVESPPPNQASDQDAAPSPIFRIRFKTDRFRDHVKNRVLGLLKNMGVQAEARIRYSEDFLNVDILTRQGAALIGRRGETLEALQHLVNRMICRNDKDMPMILVDVEGYRFKIHRRLKKIALTTAERVEKTGQPAKLEPMPPHDRKYIHKLLSETEGLTTYSMGREGQRHVVIAPDSGAGQFIGEDEELLPEFLDDPALTKRERPLFQKSPFSNSRSRIARENNEVDDLLERDKAEETPPAS